jgi:hypothetical protein
VTLAARGHDVWFDLDKVKIATPYRSKITTAPRPLALLAERVEGLVSQEHSSWAQVQQVKPAGAGP